MPQRFDEYEDADTETVYEQEEEQDYEEEYDDYEESPSLPYEAPPQEDSVSDDEEQEEEERPLHRDLPPVAETWQCMFHALQGTEGTSVSWAEMRSYLDTINIAPFPPSAPQLPTAKTQVPEKSIRVERMAQELLTNEEAYKVLKASLKDLRASLKVSTEKQVVMAEQVALQEKKKPYKWGPQPKKVMTPLESELKKLDTEITALRDMIDKVEAKERSAMKDLAFDRKNLEEEKEMWEVYKQYTAFEHTLVGPVLQ